MKILDVGVEWNKMWHTPPRLILYVDNIPAIDSLVYHSRRYGDYVAYLAEKDGYIDFFLSNERDKSGYGGRTFVLNTPDSKVEIVGPWSSRESVMGMLYGIDIVPAALTDEGKNGLMESGSITLELAIKACEKLENVSPIPTLNTCGEWSWQIAYLGRECPHSDYSLEDQFDKFLGVNGRCKQCGHLIYCFASARLAPDEGEVYVYFGLSDLKSRNKEQFGKLILTHNQQLLRQRILKEEK